MSDALFDSIARIARHEAGARATAGVGKVTNVFPGEGPTPDYAVTVEMRDLGLVLPRVPVAAGVLGAAAIPGVDELVVVLFMDGDYNAPVVVGRLYHPDQDPPKHKEGQIVLVLPSGESDPALSLEVEGDTPSIKLKLSSTPVTIEIVEKKVEIALAEGSDQIRVTLQTSGGGRAEIAAGDSKITLKNNGDITVSASGKLKLQGSEVEISGSAKVKVSGGQVEIN